MQVEPDFLAMVRQEAPNAREELPVYLRIRMEQAEREFEEYDQYVRDAKLHNIKVNRFALQMKSPFAALPILCERFQLVELLGESSCGIELWKTFDLTLRQTVSLRISSDMLMIIYDHKALARLDTTETLVGVSRDGIFTCTYEAQLYAMYALEYMEEDLETFLLRQPRGRLIHAQADTVAHSVARCIQFLFIESRTSHCDLRPANILVSPNLMSVRVTNLKSSRSRREMLPTIPHHRVKEMSGAHLLYCPPEAFFCLERMGNTVSCSAADVWALGVLYFVMLYGHHPLGPGLVDLPDSMKLHFVEQLRQFEHVVFPDSPIIPQETKRTIQMCLEKDPSKRLDAASLIADGWFLT
ncbi:hypothetical protein Ae201684P_004417 [Aphanomyces euteiches]|nr:hypothetical protein Ae201684P_004417 [Aphanomyces euteiches]